jgi:hypothetical protein
MVFYPKTIHSNVLTYKHCYLLIYYRECCNEHNVVYNHIVFNLLSLYSATKCTASIDFIWRVKTSNDKLCHIISICPIITVGTRNERENKKCGCFHDFINTWIYIVVNFHCVVDMCVIHFFFHNLIVQTCHIYTAITYQKLIFLVEFFVV